ncbi:CdaR family protein [Saliterribacillus persicus]|uniref:YbbR domain-containing protein n=1 Tax=Saliterribacillus persicus TaxID=930114 RepID=A0A368Y1V7_9BACI|nr:CdaR family protein [Saliterribacillus persicus]RCW73278.1 YbbR domain-containing protein [Saliterribacillus persicus]
MNKWLEKLWVIRVVSLLLAVLIFVIIAFDEKVNESSDDGFDSPFGTSNETQTLEDVPVSVQMDQDKYVVSGVPETVTVSLQGSVSMVTSTALQRNFDIYADLEGKEPGTYVIPLEHSGISNRINVYIEPVEVEVTIEERSSKDFPITIDFTNREQITPGYELGDVTADPEMVTITSSKSIVDRISIVKAFVDVTNVSESFTVDNVPIKVYDNQGNELSVRLDPPTIDVSVDVKNPSKTVPIEIQTEGELPEGSRINEMSLETEQVEIFAPEEFLGSLEQILTQPIDLSTLSEDGTIEIDLEIPTEVRTSNISQVTVNIDLDQEIEREVENVDIQMDNVQASQEITFLEPAEGTMNMTLRGYESELDELDLETIELLVEVGEREAGEYELPVEVTAPEGIEVELEYPEVNIQVEE